MDRLTVPEAAQRLGITRDAVYKRVRRDQIPWEKDAEGKVYVFLDQSMDNADSGEYESVDTSDGAGNSLIETLREEVEAWREEARRKDTIIAQMNQTIAALTERIPAIEAPPDTASSEPRESSITPSKDTGNGETPPDTERSWWRRLFG